MMGGQISKRKRKERKRKQIEKIVKCSKHPEIHLWSYESGENGKLKRLALKAITKRNALADTK